MNLTAPLSYLPRIAAPLTAAAAVLISSASLVCAASNGANLQPSYFNNGNVNIGWSLMNQNTKIKTLRIEIEPDKVTQAKTWIAQAKSNGKQVIATYHKAAVLGSDSSSELSAAGNWWRSNFRALNQAGSLQVNLMNEWGSHNISSNSYASSYNAAISLTRQVYSGNIIIDIPGWGQETHTIALAVKGTNGTRINDTNITLSTHLYPGDWNQALNHWVQTSDLFEMGGVGRACIVGEFGTGSGGSNWSSLVDTARNSGWSVLGWSWNGDGGGLNMVSPSWAQNATASSFSKSGYFNTVYNKL